MIFKQRKYVIVIHVKNVNPIAKFSNINVTNATTEVQNRAALNIKRHQQTKYEGVIYRFNQCNYKATQTKKS